MIVAVEVGTSKVVAVLGKLTANKKVEVVEVATVKSRGVKRGIIYDIDEVIEVLDEVVNDLKQKTEEDIKTVFTNITGDGLRLLEKNASIPINHTVTFNDKEQLDNQNYHHVVGEDEKVVQFFPIYYKTADNEEMQDPIGKSTRRLTAYYNVLIGRKNPINDLKNCFENIDITVKEPLVGIIASADAVLTEEEKKNGVVVLDIGAGTTEMAIYVDGVLQHVKVIPFGGESVTNDIKTCYDILWKQAEQLKIEFGDAVPDNISKENNKDIAFIVNKKERLIPLKDLAKIVNARMDEIMDEAWRDIKSKHLQGKLKAGIVLTGGGAALKNLDVLLHQKMGLKVRLGKPSPSGNIMLGDLTAFRFATSVGMLLQGIHYAKQKEKLQLQKQAKNKGKGFLSSTKSFFSKIMNVDNDEF